MEFKKNKTPNTQHWKITFSMLNGYQKVKQYKSFVKAKKQYDKHLNNMGIWYAICMEPINVN